MSRKQLKANTHAISTLAIVLIVIVVVASVVGALVVWWLLVGSVNLVTDEMELSDFAEVEVGWAFDIEIIQSASYSVIISADEYVEVSRTGEDEYERKLTFDYIKVSKMGDVLSIGLEQGYNYRSANLLRPLTLRAEVTMPDLLELRLSGASHGTVEGFSFSHEFNLSLSGASSLEISDLSAGNVTIDLSGASNLNGEGEADNLFINASGASRLELSDFPVHNVNVVLSGASRATINLDGRLDANLSGASRVRYMGDPTMGNIQTSDASTVEEK